MPVNINTIYQRVLDIANKEQRGYITPKQFNIFAEQAQMEIFDSYFYDSEVYGRTKPNDSEHSDRHDIIQEKIEFFQKEVYGAELIFRPDNFRSFLMYTPHDFYKIETVLVAEVPSNVYSLREFAEGEDTGFDIPKDQLYTDINQLQLERNEIVPVVSDEEPVDASDAKFVGEGFKDFESTNNVFGPRAFAVNEAEYVSKKQLVNIMGNSLTRPTMRRPVYTFEGRAKDFIRVFGKDRYPDNYSGTQKYFLDPSYPSRNYGAEGVPPGDGRSPRFRDFDHNGVLDTANIPPELLIINYIRKPRTPRWGYQEQELTNKTRVPIYVPAFSQNFELHASEGSSLTNKILELAGVHLKQADISQVGRTKSQEKSQIRNR